MAQRAFTIRNPHFFFSSKYFDYRIKYFYSGLISIDMINNRKYKKTELQMNRSTARKIELKSISI